MPVTRSCMSDGVTVQGQLRVNWHDPLLEGAPANTYTQFGEDGLIQAVFARIGTTNQWCFEVGAADGRFYSNTLLWREQGWHALLAESSPLQFAALQKNYASQRVHTVHEEVTDLDGLLSRFKVPLELDLGVIDIDGQDYWLWHDMTKHRPRVMLVEYHWSHGDDYIPPRGGEHQQQAGRDAVIELGWKKGYVAVAETHVNLLFVQEALWPPSGLTSEQGIPI